VSVAESTDTIDDEGVISDGRLEALQAAPYAMDTIISIVDLL
jgi:hypothetical protein